MKQLIFVYNANSGLFNSLTDFTHKIISPSTYRCSLCALTYGDFAMKSEWKSFIQELPVEVLFLYKDEFEKQYKENIALPAAFLAENGMEKQIIFQQEIKSCNTLDELKSLVAQKLKENDVLTDYTDKHR